MQDKVIIEVQQVNELPVNAGIQIATPLENVLWKTDMTTGKPRIIIIGAGFAGLSAARNLAHASVEILLVDKHNYHTFTPLLYQVATCALDPSEIAYPVRSIFRKQANIDVILGHVIDINLSDKKVVIEFSGCTREESYDFLIVAAGTITNYFGNLEIQNQAFGLKDLQDSVRLRNHILRMFERTSWTTRQDEQHALTTMVVVGGGPTGLETAGALYELYNDVLSREFHGVGGLTARVVLVEATDRVLAPYPERLQEAALRQLNSLGVEVKLGKRIVSVNPGQIILEGGEVIGSHTLIWAAGVNASPVVQMLGVELAVGGRIPVSDTLETIGYPEVYAVGDIAYLLDNNTGKPYPQVIPVAQQQGKLAAQNIVARLERRAVKSFRYHDRGIMATIGRRRAVAWPYYKLQLSGFLAWVTWLFLHLFWLMGFRNRLNVMVNWIWNYLTYDRSVRIILSRDPAKTSTEPSSQDDASRGG